MTHAVHCALCHKSLAQLLPAPIHEGAKPKDPASATQREEVCCALSSLPSFVVLRQVFPLQDSLTTYKSLMLPNRKVIDSCETTSNALSSSVVKQVSQIFSFPILLLVCPYKGLDFTEKITVSLVLAVFGIKLPNLNIFSRTRP